MFETYIPGFSNMLMNSDMLTFQPELTGGGPAMVDFSPFLPEVPLTATAPIAKAPFDVPIMREIKNPDPLVPVAKTPIAKAPPDVPIMREIKSPSPAPLMPGAAQVAQPPSIMPSPSAPPIMSQPGTPASGLSEAFPGGLTPEVLASILSTAPGAAGRTISPEMGAYYGLTPTGLATRDGQQGVYFTDERGWRHSAGIGDNASGFIAADPNAQYRLVDERGRNNIAAEGTGLSGLQDIRNTASKLNLAGKKANWGLERLNPTTGQWERIAENNPTTLMDQLGRALDIALPIAGAALLPGLGFIGSKVLAAGLGAAAGSGLSSAAQGRSLKDTLLRAGLTGVTAGGLAGVGGALGGAASRGASGVGGSLGGALAAAGPAAQAALNATLPGIVVSGALGSVAGGALGSAAGSALGSALAGGTGQPAAPRPPQQPTQQPEGNIVVTGTPQTPGFNVVTGALPAFIAGAPAFIPETIGTPIEVPGERTIQEEFDAVSPPPPGVPPASPSVTETIGNPITVTADPNAPAAINAATAAATALGVLPTGGVLPSGQAPTGGETTLETDRGVLDRLRDRLGELGLSDYLRLSGVVLPLLDGAGGGRRGGLNTIPGNMFGGSSIFSGGLPRATLPGASTGFAPRPASTLRPQTSRDYYRYGYGPEQSFFSYVPEGERNLSQAYTGYAHGGMAEGGDSFAVNGPGTGRSDEIPAMLSDGEYVMDAETVALLGDGSPKAGAERLDQFRINVRRDKGRKLAKGEFSGNAKRPEHYLKGGRA